MRLLPSAVALLALPALTSAGCIWDQPGHACNFACNMQDIQAGCKERGINTPGSGLGSQCKWCAELRSSYECQQGYMEDLWQAEQGCAHRRPRPRTPTPAHALHLPRQARDPSAVRVGQRKV